ncbi:hypothetical protein KCH_19120 [Kitasatospora cheerisanensis KCTC 2395]|uniref:Uncharacterized protein n=1 Tax=Kitasatospora cheerisanensis KCTC 2395 TaxID=1348663 RepID=A0A066Z7D2_9ACTN|nr:hypothetical protein KCH_19120 [Kitasatospora cheerisanensis KCTC 2395]
MAAHVRRPPGLPVEGRHRGSAVRRGFGVRGVRRLPRGRVRQGRIGGGSVVVSVGVAP